MDEQQDSDITAPAAGGSPTGRATTALVQNEIDEITAANPSAFTETEGIVRKLSLMLETWEKTKDGRILDDIIEIVKGTVHISPSGRLFSGQGMLAFLKTDSVLSEEHASVLCKDIKDYLSLDVNKEAILLIHSVLRKEGLFNRLPPQKFGLFLEMCVPQQHDVSATNSVAPPSIMQIYDTAGYPGAAENVKSVIWLIEMGKKYEHPRPATLDTDKSNQVLTLICAFLREKMEMDDQFDKGVVGSFGGTVHHRSLRDLIDDVVRSIAQKKRESLMKRKDAIVAEFQMSHNRDPTVDELADALTALAPSEDS